MEISPHLKRAPRMAIVVVVPKGSFYEIWTPYCHATWARYNHDGFVTIYADINWELNAIIDYMRLSCVFLSLLRIGFLIVASDVCAN